MRKVSLIILLVLFTTTLTFPCTNLLVGKKASTDGSTIISYAADSYGLYGELYHWPAKEYKPGEMLKVYEWDSGKYLGEIDRKSTRLNSSHVRISYAVFCLKKK